jgi:hypothetical protein
MFIDDGTPIRPFQAPPRNLPDAIPRFFLRNDKAFVTLDFLRNPHNKPTLPVTAEIAAQYPVEWGLFVAEQEALAAERAPEVSGE